MNNVLKILYFILHLVPFGHQNNCPKSKCLKLSECGMIDKFLKDFDEFPIILNKFCGYWSEPHICCEPIKNSTCITPNGKSGQCLPLTNCEKLFNNTLSQSEAEFTFTYDSFCGWYTKPLVCCGEDDDYLENFIHNLPEETDCGLWNDVNNIPPWLVLITGEYECLGTIINKNYILTKASCIVSISNLRVELADCPLNNQTDCVLHVNKKKIFPIFNIPFKNNNDIALLKFSKSEDIPTIMPVCLQSEDLPVDIEVFVSRLSGDNLQKYKLENYITLTIPQNKCKSKNEYMLREFCLSYNAHSCSEYILSGTPVHMSKENRWFLVGSSKMNNCTNGVLSFDRVFEFIRWIRSNVS